MVNNFKFMFIFAIAAIICGIGAKLAWKKMNILAKFLAFGCFVCIVVFFVILGIDKKDRKEAKNPNGTATVVDNVNT
jgi:uncharacterized membrane protein YfcA